MKKKTTKTVTCSICGNVINGYGNNAWPINDSACCDACNYIHVIPARIAQLKNSCRTQEVDNERVY